MNLQNYEQLELATNLLESLRDVMLCIEHAEIDHILSTSTLTAFEEVHREVSSILTEIATKKGEF